MWVTGGGQPPTPQYVAVAVKGGGAGRRGAAVCHDDRRLAGACGQPPPHVLHPCRWIAGPKPAVTDPAIFTPPTAPPRGGDQAAVVHA